jgi:alkylation response protein AidB-like acyl-CoA dehydrogenase
MGTLAFERGVLTLGQQMSFERELGWIVDDARRTGAIDDPTIRQKLADLAIRLRIMRWSALRNLSVDENVELVPAAMVGKLYWANLHQDMGEVALDVLGAEAMATLDRYGADGDALDAHHRLFFFSRADTIYGGSDQIQRNIIGERALGLPREPQPAKGA